MGDLMNLARPDIWELVAGVTQAAIGAELVDLEYEFRPTWDGAGYDVYAVFVVLWKRQGLRGDPTKEGWGTHRGCVRQEQDKEPYAHLDSGHYNQNESAAREDYVERQVGLG